MDVVTTSEPIRLVQISDTHLEPAEGGTLLGMDTDRSLRHVLALVQRENTRIDLVLATGDAEASILAMAPVLHKRWIRSALTTIITERVRF